MSCSFLLLLHSVSKVLVLALCTLDIPAAGTRNLQADRNLEKSDTFTAECKAGVRQRKRCYDAALRQDGSLDFDRYLVLLDADVRGGNHSIGAPANEP